MRIGILVGVAVIVIVALVSATRAQLRPSAMVSGPANIPMTQPAFAVPMPAGTPVASVVPSTVDPSAPPAAGTAVAPMVGSTADPSALSAGTTPDPKIAELAAWGEPPAPNIDPRRFTEAHWQGIEVIPKTPIIAAAINIPKEASGVIIDDVTLPADLQGFQAGDLVTSVGQVPTPDLMSFIRATDRLRDRQRAHMEILRNGRPQNMLLTALLQRLGTANGETPGMIPPGARMPHPYRGPCTNCHRIGTTGNLMVDQGDLVTPTAPIIRAGQGRPHVDRGPCSVCHQIVP